MKHQKALALIMAVILLVTACCIVSVGVYSGGGNREETTGYDGSTEYNISTEYEGTTMPTNVEPTSAEPTSAEPTSAEYNEPIYGTLDNLRYEEYGNYVVITGYSGNFTSIEIPSSINGKPVTSIFAGAFSGCRSLRSIIIPDSVTHIGSGAVDDTAYYDNESNWENGVLYIGKHLIRAKENISGSYTVKNGTKTIVDQAFFNCRSLQYITIPDSMTSIGWCAFGDCSSLQSITIPDSVTSIGHEAFYCCSSLKEVHISSISAWCNIRFEISANPLSYGAELYLNNNRVENLVIPDGIPEIKNYTFAGFRSLKSITIPDSVTSIGSGAFSYCESLQSITIPDSVTSIGDWAFSGCRSLKYVFYTGTEKDWNSISIGGDNFSLLNTKQYYNVGEDYKLFDNVLYNKNSSLLIIYCNYNKKYCILPNTVKSIEQNAFAGSIIQTIILNEGIKNIGSSAFNNA